MKLSYLIASWISSVIVKIRPAKRYNRSHWLDAIRGGAIIMMVIFHFFYDLTLFGLAEIPIYSSTGWIVFRFIILSSFLGTAGAALYLHHTRGINYSAYARRVMFITINAWAITLVTYVMLAEQYVFFGILHLIALSSILGLLFVRLYWLNLILGLAILVLGYNYSNAIFDNFGTRWIGMLPRATGSADFTPIFPFFGLVLLGMFVARFLGSAIYAQSYSQEHSRDPNARMLKLGLAFRITSGLAGMGRYSLIIYMIHQPIIWGLLYIYILIK